MGLDMRSPLNTDILQSLHGAPGIASDPGHVDDPNRRLGPFGGWNHSKIPSSASWNTGSDSETGPSRANRTTPSRSSRKVAGNPMIP